MAKSEETRALLIDTALEMFRHQGFAKTTMRAIADAAGVSLGNAYYYFSSKEDLVQELYSRIQLDHEAKARAAVVGESKLSKRLAATLLSGIEVMAPYHEFGAEFIRTAISPTSSSSPFSKASTDSRELSINIFRNALEGSDSSLPKSLRDELPELLWLGYLALVFFWVNDSSKGQERTRTLALKSAPFVSRLVGLSRLPFARPLISEGLGLIKIAKGL